MIGMILVHVDDFQIAGSLRNAEFKTDYDHIAKLYRWGMSKSDKDGYTVCGVDVLRTDDGGFL